jgi:hypothetical protein
MNVKFGTGSIQTYSAERVTQIIKKSSACYRLLTSIRLHKNPPVDSVLIQFRSLLIFPSLAVLCASLTHPECFYHV